MTLIAHIVIANIQFSSKGRCCFSVYRIQADRIKTFSPELSKIKHSRKNDGGMFEITEFETSEVTRGKFEVTQLYMWPMTRG